MLGYWVSPRALAVGVLAVRTLGVGVQGVRALGVEALGVGILTLYIYICVTITPILPYNVSINLFLLFSTNSPVPWCDPAERNFLNVMQRGSCSVFSLCRKLFSVFPV